MDDSDTKACTMLEVWGAKVADVLLHIVNVGHLRSKPYRVAGEIATRLYLISGRIKASPKYILEADVECLCRELLIDFVKLLGRQPSRASFLPNADEAYRYLCSHLAQKDQRDLKDSLLSVLVKQADRVEHFSLLCLELHQKLASEDPDSTENFLEAIPHLHRTEYAADINSSLYDVLELHSVCLSDIHGPGLEGNTQRHPTIIHLEGDADKPEKMASFDICVSSPNMTRWLEFCLQIPREPVASSTEAKEQSHNDTALTARLISKGDFCNFLEEPVFACIGLQFMGELGLRELHDPPKWEQGLLGGGGESLSKVLQDYRLAPEDKILLASAISRSYWQFYDSKLMRTKWTSETICFMPDDKYKGESRPLPLRAYTAFKFGNADEPLEDFEDKWILYHRCPRIFALGILLLEIGLAMPFQKMKFPDAEFQTQILFSEPAGMNLDYKIAQQHLARLEQTAWPNFKHKAFFVEAVRNCFDYKNFATPPDPQKTAGAGLSELTQPRGILDKSVEISRRRQRLYRKVVKPLTWLAKSGFPKSSQNVKYVRKSHEIPSLDKSTVSRAQQQGHKIDTRATVEQILSSGSGTAVLRENEISSEKWFDDLESVNLILKASKNLAKVDNEYQPVKVAVIDTGFDPNHRARRNIVNYKDFVTAERADDGKGIKDKTGVGQGDDSLDSMMDHTGHGTTSVELILKVYKDARLYVCRVFETNHANEKFEPYLMADAIEWAVRHKVDIISISAGFRTCPAELRKAALSAYKDNILIFASAANWSYKAPAAFPAGLLYPPVFCIFATNAGLRNSTGFNPPARQKARNFAILGEDIRLPSYQKPIDGTSAATAIAAGFAARILDFSRQPDIRCRMTKSNSDTLRSMGGMTAVFSALATEDNNYECIDPSRILENFDDDEDEKGTVGDKNYERIRERENVRRFLVRALKKAC